MKHVGDITKLKGAELPVVDILTGGSPCQDLSLTGKRAGFAGERSGLFMEQIRLIKEMRENDKRTNGRTDATARPRFMVWENVPGAFSSNGGEDFRAVLEETARVVDENADVPGPADGWESAGAILGDGWSIAWRVHDAQFWGRTIRDLDTGNVLKLGTPQRRRRIALVADFNGGSATEILFESYSLSGDFEQGQESREGTSEGFGGCTDPASRVIEDWVSAVNSSAIHQQDLIQSDLGIARTLAPGTHASGSHLTKTLVTSGAISFQERARCAGGGKGILIQNERTGALSTLNNQAVMPINKMVMEEQPILLESNQNHATIQTNGISTTLPASMGEGGGYVPMVFSPTAATRCAKDGPGGVHTQMLADPESNFVCEPYAASKVSRFTSFNKGTAETLLATDYKDPPTVAYGFDPGASRDVGDLFIKETSKTLSNGTCPGHHNGVVYGLDRSSYNQGANAKVGFSVDEEKNGCQTAMGPGAVAVDCRNGVESEINASLQASADHNNNSNNVCRSGCVVRRLTPLECTRLQGFPDGWVDIGEWTDSKGKKHKDSDAPKYKALGNSIALPFWAWMAKRMRKQFTQENVTMASLFDGIGGFPLVYSWAGVKPVWCSEIEEFCIALTKLRFPEEEQ